MNKHINIKKIDNKISRCNCCKSKENLVEISFTTFIDKYNNSSNVVCLCKECLNELKETLNVREKEMNKYEKIVKLALTKFVPFENLSPNFCDHETWLENITYDYYLFLSEEQEYPIEKNEILSEEEFNLVYEVLLEEFEKNGN